MFTYESLRRYIPFRIRNKRNRTCFLHISRYLGPYSPLWASIESRKEIANVPLMTGTGVSHNSGIIASKGNPISCVQAGGDENMSFVLAGK